MTSAAGTIPPPVSWAQRSDLLYVIIEVECKDIEHKVTESSFHFEGVNALDGSVKYDLTLNFLHEVDPERVSSKNIGRCIEFTIYKKQSGGAYWPSLTTDKTKLHFLKANFSKWTNESDEDESANEDDLPNNYMKNANLMDCLSNFDPDDDDSDENIPSLSQNDEDEEEEEITKDK